VTARTSYVSLYARDLLVHPDHGDHHRVPDRRSEPVRFCTRRDPTRPSRRTWTRSLFADGQPPAQHPPPQQPLDPDAIPAPAGAAALPASVTADHTRLTSSCPLGHRTPAASVVIERRTSKTLSQTRQR